MKYKKSKTQQKKEQRIMQDIQDNLDLSPSDICEKIGISRKTYDLYKKRLNTFQEHLEEHGFSQDFNHGWLKVDGASIHIKNNLPEKTYLDVRDELIEEMKQYAPEYKKISYEVKNDGHLLVIDLADIHFGKLATLIETRNEYDLEIAERRCIEAVIGLLEKSKNFHIDEIHLIIGNDLLHTDTPFRKTTAGTPQDTNGMWTDAFKVAKNTLIKVIEQLRMKAKLKVIFNPSNHDYMSGYFLADTLSSWFNNSGVEFDVSIRHRKYHVYGNSLIGSSHGDGAKEINTPLIMAQEEPEMWAKTKYRYIYLHHLHHKIKKMTQSAKDYVGVTIEYMRSPSGTDRWHFDNGYLSHKAIEGFIHSRENGQVAKLTHYF